MLDLSRVLAGPLCAMVAGDLGADVIKVESPSGDPVRSLGAARFGDDATYYLAVNRHRRNVVADLRDPRDFERIGELVRLADAVVENYLPSQVHVARHRPAARTEPRLRVGEHHAGDDRWSGGRPAVLRPAGAGEVGHHGRHRRARRRPTKVGAPVADVVTGLYGAIGLLAGLFARCVVARGVTSRHRYWSRP